MSLLLPDHYLKCVVLFLLAVDYNRKADMNNMNKGDESFNTSQKGNHYGLSFRLCYQLLPPCASLERHRKVGLGRWK